MPFWSGWRSQSHRITRGALDAPPYMMDEKILLVDDELKVLKAYERNLSADFAVVVASSGDQALTLLEREGPFAVLLTDYNMPGMNGNELLNRARAISPDTVRIMLTGYADLEKTITAVNEGSVFRFLTKPCPVEQLTLCLGDAIRQYNLVTAERELLNKTLGGSIQVMMEILGILNHAAFALAQKRRSGARALIRELGASNAWAIEIGAMLADIGMVTLPDDTMQRFLKGEVLSETEKKMVNDLPEMSARLIQKIPRLEEVARIVRYQRKDYNGGGLPVDEVSGTSIPEGARIIRVLNDYFRVLGKGASAQEAYNMLSVSREWYDPAVLKALARVAKGISGPSGAGSRLRKVGAKSLVVGQTLRSDIFGKDGTLILRANTVLGAAHVQRINNFDASFGVKGPILVEG